MVYLYLFRTNIDPNFSVFSMIYPSPYQLSRSGADVQLISYVFSPIQKISAPWDFIYNLDFIAAYELVLVHISFIYMVLVDKQ